MITPENLVRHELIGLEVLVEKSTNRSQENLSGKILDETRQTFTVKAESGEKQVVKDQCIFVFVLPSGKKVRVDGKVLVARPEDRIKKKLKNW